MSTSIDIHRVTRVQILDAQTGAPFSATRQIVIKTLDNSDQITITLYGNNDAIPIILGETGDE